MTKKKTKTKKKKKNNAMYKINIQKPSKNCNSDTAKLTPVSSD